VTDFHNLIHRKINIFGILFKNTDPGKPFKGLVESAIKIPIICSLSIKQVFMVLLFGNT